MLDKSYGKRVLNDPLKRDLHKRVVMLPVSGAVHIRPVEFLCTYLPPSALSLGPKVRRCSLTLVPGLLRLNL
jgi:hypothetical protein